MGGQSSKWEPSSERDGLMHPHQRDTEEDGDIPARVVYINEPSLNALFTYPSNFTRTHKYTAWNFLPKNLFEQFRRAANFYFLLITLIQLIPDTTPIPPVTSIFPLIVVISISAVKDGYEDYQRYLADKAVNGRRSAVVRNARVESSLCMDLVVGDIVYVSEGEEFPADLILLATSGHEGTCYVETSNLDGETNLKVKRAPTATASLVTPAALSTLQGRVECEAPNADLYRFEGRLVITASHEKCPLTISQLLLRGSVLRNTHYVMGLVMYSGSDAKILLNAQEAPSKFSRVEAFLNHLVVVVFVFQLFVAFFSTTMCILWKEMEGGDAWYLDLKEEAFHWVWVPIKNFLTFLILYNFMIPISLIVSAEMVKVVNALLIWWDLELYDEDAQQPVTVNTSGLVEELGQIQYIFTDKTGTLTENVMRLRKLSIGGVRHTVDNLPTDDESVRAFLLTLALCHTAEPSHTAQGGLKFQVTSPDEEALLSGAHAAGVSFHSLVDKKMSVRIGNEEFTYTILDVLEFSSSRKRMSILLRRADGTIWLLCKGAESVIFPRLTPGQTKADMAWQHITEYANEGLRTLCFASRDVSEEEYVAWASGMREAEAMLHARTEKMEEHYELIEKDLVLLGATGIEDRLQLDVPETLRDLQRGGIRVWMLTGDKQETAISIGRSCNLIFPDTVMILINAKTAKHCEALLRENVALYGRRGKRSRNNGNRTLVIDGVSLAFVFDGEQHRRLFVHLCSVMQSVVCCRMSPLQKALVIRLMKERPNPPITLAVGDGANDVSMIQEANVGIGIKGREGRQAARSSDYAVAEFRMLKRLLLVHGRYSYIRVSTLIQYSFYKNMAFSLPLFYFGFFSGFSGQILYDPFLMMIFNIIFTSWPILVVGIFEQDVPDKAAMEHPQLYRRLAQGEEFSNSTFLNWILSSVWHSLLIFFGVVFLYKSDLLVENGQTFGLWGFATMSLMLCIVIVNLKIGIETRYWTVWNHISVWGSIAVFFAFLYPYCLLLEWSSMYGVVCILICLSSPVFFLDGSSTYVGKSGIVDLHGSIRLHCSSPGFLVEVVRCRWRWCGYSLHPKYHSAWRFLKGDVMPDGVVKLWRDAADDEEPPEDPTTLLKK